MQDRAVGLGDALGHLRGPVEDLGAGQLGEAEGVLGRHERLQPVGLARQQPAHDVVFADVVERVGHGSGGAPAGLGWFRGTGRTP